jgi:hypothetical protein
MEANRFARISYSKCALASALLIAGVMFWQLLSAQRARAQTNNGGAGDEGATICYNSCDCPQNDGKTPCTSFTGDDGSKPSTQQVAYYQSTSACAVYASGPNVNKPCGSLSYIISKNLCP